MSKRVCPALQIFWEGAWRRKINPMLSDDSDFLTVIYLISALADAPFCQLVGWLYFCPTFDFSRFFISGSLF
jgi:hypothetical protein